MSRPVPPCGPLNAKIAIVGEAPGRQEEALGIPFVGASGRLLDDMLLRCGIERSSCYITNVMKIRPPNNDFGYFYEDKKRTLMKEPLHLSTTRLSSELQKVQPNVVLALGNEAMKALLSTSGVTKWRGSILESTLVPGLKVIPTFHPASVLRMYSQRAIVEFDLRRILAESHSSRIDLPVRNKLIKPSFLEVKRFLSRDFSRGLSFDIETIGSRVRCLGLSDSPDRAICIPFIRLSYDQPTTIGGENGSVFFQGGSLCSSHGNYWSEEDEWEILGLLKGIFSNPKVPKIAQNYPFDSTRLGREFGLYINGLWMDTLACHHCVYSELPKNLDFLCSIYTRSPRYSDHVTTNDTSEWKYNCMDAMVTYEVAMKVHQEAKDAGVWRFYKDHVEPAMISLTRAQNRGMNLDVPEQTRQKERTQVRLDKNLHNLKGLAGTDAFNPNSPKQVKELVYGKLGCPEQYKKDHKTHTKRVTTDDDALTALGTKIPEHKDLFETILACRKDGKAIGAYLSALPNKKGRLLTSYFISGTVTGRVSSSKTLEDTGISIQQLTKSEIRRMIIPQEGNLFIKTDLKQAEAMFVMWDAGVRSLIDRYLNDPTFDIHTWNAGVNIWKIPEGTVTKAQRSIAKAGVHGGNYGMQAGTASKQYGVSFQEAKLSLEAYRSGIPELAGWWADIEDRVSSTRTLVNPFGRRRVFMGRVDQATFRSAYSFKPQSTICDIILKIFALSDRQFPSEIFPLIQMHDEIVFECPVDRLEEGVDLIRDAYNIPITFKGVPEPLVIPVEISYGPNWWDQKEVV